MPRSASLMFALIMALAVSAGLRAAGQSPAAQGNVDATLSAPSLRHAAPAVVWLSALPGTPSLSFSPHGTYTLLQKNRTFEPHLQVVPVSAVVQFPNADPFFHNVFSLFDGKRFDLGLYEAGSSRAVTFPREGVSYIFCNIHPEMSAVILTLSTPLYAKGKTGEPLAIRGVPPGDYELQVWVEGVQAGALQTLRRKLHVEPGATSHQEIPLNVTVTGTQHKDKFGKDYAPESRDPY